MTCLSSEAATNKLHQFNFLTLAIHQSNYSHSNIKAIGEINLVYYVCRLHLSTNNDLTFVWRKTTKSQQRDSVFYIIICNFLMYFRTVSLTRSKGSKENVQPNVSWTILMNLHQTIEYTLKYDTNTILMNNKMKDCRDIKITQYRNVSNY